ncbi:MAG: rhodanese-like domain-containing protein [Pseudomonadota bacterium]
MTPSSVTPVDDVTPDQAWDTLASTPGTLLVDVRTAAEWSFVGTPDLSSAGKDVILIEWAMLPGMQRNPEFEAGLMAHLSDGSAPSEIYFLCRSGVRSLAAADAAAQAFAKLGKPIRCINVAEGFEGDLNDERHRGQRNGWKARGLPWRQS